MHKTLSFGYTEKLFEAVAHSCLIQTRVIVTVSHYQSEPTQIEPLTVRAQSGNTKGRSITVPLTSWMTGLESAICQLTIFVFICKTDYFKPVKQEVKGTAILTLLVFPGPIITLSDSDSNRLSQAIFEKLLKMEFPKETIKNFEIGCYFLSWASIINLMKI